MSTETITPTAIDAFVHVEFVRVVGRHRYALGDLAALAESIDDIGLLHPVTLTRDGRLIAGHRRLEACRMLGWTEIPARFVDSLDDAARLLRAERDENTCRKDMLPSELASLGEALYALEAAEAKSRIRRGQENGRAARYGLDDGTRTTVQDAGPTVDAVGPALGMSGRTYSELRYAYKIATDSDAAEGERQLGLDALSAMDRGAGIAGEARRLRGQLRAKQDAQDAKDAALADVVPDPPVDDLWVPAQRDSSRVASAQRKSLIRHYAERSHTSHQIGQIIGVLPETVRRIARDLGIAIAADEALGARTRKTIDSNRVIRETVTALDGLAMGVKLANLDELDEAEVNQWASSLTNSLRVLNRLARQMKEKARGD